MASASFLSVAILLFALQVHAALPNGSPCVRDTNCNNRCFKGYCTSQVGIGGTCDYKWECTGALICRDRKCAHKGGFKNLKSLKGDGVACRSNMECKNVCIKQRCASRRRAGGTCSRTDQCYGKLVCRNGKCQEKKGFGKQNGRKCRYDYECINICLAGTCRNARFFRQTCFKNIHCKEDLVCINRQCRSSSFKTTPSPPAAIPRPAKVVPRPPRATPTPKAMNQKKQPVQAPVPERKETKSVVTKEGKTAGAQAAIQVTKEGKEQPKKGLLRNGKGAGAKPKPETRADIIKLFFCMVHKEECPK